MLTLSKKEKARWSMLITEVNALPEGVSYETYKPLVLAALKGIGPVLWQKYDEGSGYMMTRDRFHMVRTVRNTDTKELFDAILKRK